MPGRDPAAIATFFIRKRRVECGFKSVRMIDANLDLVEMLQGWQNYLRSKEATTAQAATVPSS